MAEPFQWGSLLGVSVMLFLAASLFRLFIGVATPIALRTFAGDSTLFVSERSDTAAYGKSPSTWVAEDPALRPYRNALWTLLAGFLSAAAIVEAGVAWFGLREGHAWALWVLAVEGVVMILYWLLSLGHHFAARAPLTLADIPPFMWVPAMLLVPAVACGWLALR